MTNITDTPGDGTTVTTLVPSHDHGSTEFNRRRGEGRASESGEAFNPDDHTVEEVKVYVEAHPDEAEAILAAETAGKNRVTLVDSLENDTEQS